jgi:hypothetical protein
MSWETVKETLKEIASLISLGIMIACSWVICALLV